MAVKKKKKPVKKSSSKKEKPMSKADKLRARKEKLKKGGGNYDTFVLTKEGTYRMRSVPVIDEMENGVKVIRFYTGGDPKSFISPASLGMPCAFEDKYQELSNSEDEDDQEIAGKMGRGIRYVMPHYRYQDEKGKKVDEDAGVKLMLMTNGQYQDWIDFFLEDEIGDPSDPVEGFDIKYKREGTGKFDTEYSLLKCKNTKAFKKFAKAVDPEEMLKEILPSYEQTEKYLEEFLSKVFDDEEDDEEEDELSEKSSKKAKMKKRKSEKKGKSTKKKKKKK